MHNVKKANLFIVGAMKAGTTSFNELLVQHPSIYFSPIKEPNYFVENLPETLYKPSRYFNIDQYFKKEFPNPLHIAYLKEKVHYEKLFEPSTEEHIYRAEGSTAYLHASESAQLIHKYNPDAKIIILLRDPLKRAFSHYKMNLGLGKIKDSFEECIKKDLMSFEDNKLSPWSFLGMSIYYGNVLRYKELFGANILVLHFEDIIKNKQVTIRQLNSFLDLNLKTLSAPHKNQTGNLRFQKTLFFLKQLGLKDIFSKVVPQSIRHFIFKILNKKKPLELELTEHTQSKLKVIFEKDKIKLKELLK